MLLLFYSFFDSWQIRVFKEEQTIFNFANTTTSFPAQTVKFNLNVQRWPFYSISNFLSINLDAKSNNQVEDDNVCVNDKKDEKENVKWFMLSVDGISLYLFIFIFIFFV